MKTAIFKGKGIIVVGERPEPNIAEGAFYRNVGMRGGPAPVRAYMTALLDAILTGTIHPGRVFDFTTDLDHIADAYAAMDERRAIKSLIKVSER